VSGEHPIATTETVDLAKAVEWLGVNVNNRRESQSTITRFADAMLRGEWKLNGEAIKFDWNGHLMDGQTRLTAVIRAAETDPTVSFRTLVIRNLPPEVKATMDSGRKRTLADNLTMAGEVNTLALAAALNRLHLWEEGETAMRNPSAYLLTYAQAAEMLERMPRIRDAVKIAQSISGRMGGFNVNRAVLAACVYRFHQLEPRDSVAFWTAVADGVGLQKTSPMMVLRKTLIANAARKQKYPPFIIHALVVKAWNAYREGRPIELLTFRGGGASPEKFPEPV
jgi:hypothetical protein